MSTLRISNIEAKSVPASATVDEKVKITNSSGDTLVFIDGKTSGITTVGINTTDGNIKFDANSNIVVTGIITATKFVGTIEPTDLTVSGKVSVGGSVTAATFYGNGANLTGLSGVSVANQADNRLITATGTTDALNGEANLTFETSTSGGTLTVAGTSEYQIKLKDTNSSGNAAETALAFTDSGDTIQGFVGFNYWGDGNLDIQNNNSGGSVCINTGGGNERLKITSGGNIQLPVNGQQLTWGASQQMKFYYENSEDRMYLQGDGEYGFAFRVNNGNALEIDKTTRDVTMQGASGRNFLWDNSEPSLYLTDNGTNSARLKIGTGGDLQLYHDVSGNVNHISAATNGDIKFSANKFYFYDYTGVTQRFRIDANGRVEINNASRPASDANEGAQLRVTGTPLTRNQYYSPAGHYYGSFGYTDNTYDKSWIAVDSSYAKSSAVSAGLFLSPFHQDAGGSGCGFTIKNLKTGNALVFSRVKTAASTGNPAVEEERVRITAAGNVGIGSDIPSKTLDVSGNIRCGNFTIDRHGDPTINMVSTSDTGGGSIYFGSPASGVRGGILYDHNNDQLKIYFL